MSYDKRYDAEFELIKGLSWTPWVGQKFKDAKIKRLLLTESHYDDWKDYTPEQSAEMLADKNFTRNRTAGPAMNGNQAEDLYRNFERAVYGKKSVSLEEGSAIWEHSALMNIVQRVMPTINHRPNRQDFCDGWDVVWEVSKITGIEQVIVFGSAELKVQTMRKLLESKSVSIDAEVWSDVTLGSKSYGKAFSLSGVSTLKKIVFIKHTSSYFSWENCRDFFKKIRLELS